MCWKHMSSSTAHYWTNKKVFCCNNKTDYSATNAKCSGFDLSHSMMLTLQKLLLRNDVLCSLQNVWHVHLIPELLLLVFQEHSLKERDISNVGESPKLHTSDVWQTNLVSCSDDKHPPEDKALPVHVALITRPPGPNEVPPHAKANEAQTSHPPLQRAVETFLQIQSSYCQLGQKF